MRPPVSPSEQTMWKLCPVMIPVLTVKLVVATRCVKSKASHLQFRDFHVFGNIKLFKIVMLGIIPKTKSQGTLSIGYFYNSTVFTVPQHAFAIVISWNI